ncbi:hypothetical protein SAY87_001313 [Trapa incisa]|uniref:RAB6-interacting golgin n=1 Tax=Trapa incisa TaxID=236973 RepID=A0AAN7GPC8_9MYRT|nr:hypothetical protein SAY87_001313 [Trapa incisa]
MTEDSQGRDDPSFLWIEKKEKEKVEGMSTFEKQPPQSLPQPQTQTTTPRSRKQLMLQQSSGSLSFNSNISMEEEEMSMTALSAFRAKEDEIEKWKMEVKERVLSQLGRVEEETKRLATIREELETLGDPMRKDVSSVRKKIDTVNKELKWLGHTCQRKEKEYKDTLDAFNEKNKEKVQLITKLMELVSESEELRLKRLEELSKNIGLHN